MTTKGGSEDPHAMPMTDDLEPLRAETLQLVSAATSLDALEAARVEALGRKGRVTEMMKTLGKLTPDDRRERGAALNRIKDEIGAAIDARKAGLARADLDRRLATERIDVTLAGPAGAGRPHPSDQPDDRGTGRDLRRNGVRGRRRSRHRG